MICIYCHHDLEVSNSRQQARSNRVWRRRSCPACTRTVTTLEAIDLSRGLYVLHGKVRQPFVRDKLFVSIYRNCQHRPQAIVDSSALTDTVIGSLLHSVLGDSLAPVAIRDQTLRTLKRFDSAAAAQYQAFHPTKRYR